MNQKSKYLDFIILIILIKQPHFILQSTMHNDGDAGSEFPSFDGADFSFSGLDDLFSNEDEDVRNDEGDTGDDYNQCSICCIFYHSSNLRSCITHSDIKICSKVCLKIHKDVAINPGDCAFLEISKDVEDVARINFRNRNKQKKKYIKLTDNEKRREIASLMSTACKCATGNCLYKPEINQQVGYTFKCIRYFKFSLSY